MENEMNQTQSLTITIQEANKLLEQNEVIDHTSNSLIVDCIKNNKKKFDDLESQNQGTPPFKDFFIKSENHYGIRRNIYIFDLAELQKLVANTEATHFMVIEGSQLSAVNNFQTGQSTMIVVPCKDLGKSDNQGKMYKSTGNDVLEHPQFRYQRTIPLREDLNVIEVNKS